MRLEDALFNWLQIRLVEDGRENDRAAADTRTFFEQLLTEDHGVTNLTIEHTDESSVHLRYDIEGHSKLQMIPRELAEQLLRDINSNPKYN